MYVPKHAESQYLRRELSRAAGRETVRHKPRDQAASGQSGRKAEVNEPKREAGQLVQSNREKMKMGLEAVLEKFMADAKNQRLGHMTLQHPGAESKVFVF